jgi:hypothetical protein
LVCTKRGEAKHVGGDRDFSEGELAAGDPRPRREHALKMIKQFVESSPAVVGRLKLTLHMRVLPLAVSG